MTMFGKGKERRREDMREKKREREREREIIISSKMIQGASMG